MVWPEDVEWRNESAAMIIQVLDLGYSQNNSQQLIIYWLCQRLANTKFCQRQHNLQYLVIKINPYGFVIRFIPVCPDCTRHTITDLWKSSNCLYCAVCEMSKKLMYLSVLCRIFGILSCYRLITLSFWHNFIKTVLIPIILGILGKEYLYLALNEIKGCINSVYSRVAAETITIATANSYWWLKR